MRGILIFNEDIILSCSLLSTRVLLAILLYNIGIRLSIYLPIRVNIIKVQIRLIVIANRCLVVNTFVLKLLAQQRITVYRPRRVSINQIVIN